MCFKPQTLLSVHPEVHLYLQIAVPVIPLGTCGAQRNVASMPYPLSPLSFYVLALLFKISYILLSSIVLAVVNELPVTLLPLNTH